MANPAFPDKVAIVTGAGSGIGLATTRRLSRQCPVIAIGRTASKLEDLVSALGAEVIPCPMDVSIRCDVHDLRDRLKSSGTTVTALINNAGFARSGSAELPLEELENNWDEVVATNLTGAFNMSMAIAPLLKRPGGRIVNISSIAAYTGGRNKGSAIYAASKSGLHGLSAGLAREFCDEAITVNTIAPGLITETEFTGNWSQSVIDSFIEEIPVGRTGNAEEIAATIEFLCGDQSGFITGEIINQNGGFRFGS